MQFGSLPRSLRSGVSNLHKSRSYYGTLHVHVAIAREVHAVMYKERSAKVLTQLLAPQKLNHVSVVWITSS